MDVNKEYVVAFYPRRKDKYGYGISLNQSEFFIRNSKSSSGIDLKLRTWIELIDYPVSLRNVGGSYPLVSENNA